jgi:predicted ATPase/DNA-binding SARP family transcriptional activator
MKHMAALTLALLGPPQATRSDGTTLAFRSRKALALLAYLAVECRHTHSRDTLLALLWPEDAEAAARNSLRVVLANLRQTLGESADLLLRVDRSGVQLLPESDHTLDVAAFGALLAACHTHRHEQIDTCERCMARLEQAVALYRGDFLAGLVLADSTAFEEWALVVREQLHQQALDALTTLASSGEGRGDHGALCRYARRQLALEPWREQAHRQLMRGLAQEGDRAGALAAYERCRQVLQAELGIEPDEETRALYEQIKAGRLGPSIPAPVSRMATPPLPTPPTLLLGRTTELALIVQRLAEPNCQLVTLTGPGGVGKTHLSLAAAHAAQSTFEGGVVFVALASQSDPKQVLPAITYALGIHDMHGQSSFASLLAALAGKHVLLVLDNFEQLTDAAPSLGDLLAQLPHLKLLITSRAALRLRAEHEIAIAPFDLPVPPWNAAAIAPNPAIALFSQRAAAIQPTFALSDTNAAAIAEICTRLDGLPLAIELAATRIKLLSPQLLLQRLNNRLDLLTSGMRDMPSRHQTLRNTIDWSYSLLEAHEQQLFARLAVFVGGGTVEAAEAICAVEGAGAIDVLDGLQSLTDKSLLRQTVGEDGTPRFNMLELIREYGLERLVGSGEITMIRGQHAAYYLQLAEQAAPELAGGQAQIAWFARIGGELDNIRAALRWALEHARVAVALRLGLALREFWMTRAHLAEGRAWLETALALHAQAPEPVDDTLRGDALTTAGWLAANARDYAAADRLFKQSLALAHRTEQPAQIIAVLGDLAQALRMQGDTARAAALYRERLTLCRDEGDMRGAAWSLCNLGIIAHAEGDDDHVEPRMEEGLAAAQALGDRICMAWCLTFLARVAKDRREHARSAAIFANTLVLFREVGHTDGIAFTLEGWAGLAAATGDPYAAARSFGAAAALREAINRVQPLYERDMAASSDTSSATWQLAWAEGHALPSDQVIAVVLGQALTIVA